MKNELEKIKTQIPIYRAEIKNAFLEDEKHLFYELDGKFYIVGLLSDIIFRDDGSIKYAKIKNLFYYGEFDIDTSTLAIHFQDMIDSQGNKIFASLSEDGKGGDIVEHDEEGCTYNANSVIYEKGTICFMNDFSNLLFDYQNLKVVGIQQ